MSKRFKYEVPNEIGKMFDNLDERAFAICALGLYSGAEVVADEIRKGIPEDSGDLSKSLFVSKFNKGYNTVDTVIGFAGYDSKGTPNPLKAAAVESGTSDGRIKATHFFSKAVRMAKSKSEAATEKTITAEINKITKG